MPRALRELGPTARVAVVSGVYGALVASAHLFGCAQVLDLAALRESSSDAGFPTDANDAVPDVQDAGPCPLSAHQACNPLLQCGCAIDENCEVTIRNGTTSCSSIGKTPLWGNCDGFGVCQKGAECVDHACKPFCATDKDCPGIPGLGRQCIQVVSGGVPISGLKTCSAGCDLVNPSDICEPGVTCNPVPWDGDGADHGDCFGGAGTGIGAGACGGNDSTRCAPGYSCVGNACAKWCRVGLTADGGDCTAPAICVSPTPTPVIARVVYGLCQ